MPLIVPTITPSQDNVNLHVTIWGPMTAGDTCQPVARGDIVDRSIQVEGTFSGAATVSIQGSNDATTNSNGNYHALHDPFSNVIAITTAGIAQVTEVTAWMKPVLGNGDGSTSLTCTVVSRMSLRG